MCHQIWDSPHKSATLISSFSPPPSSPVLIYGGHKYLCRYVTHIRWQYFRLFPVLHSQLSHCQLSASHGTTAPCLHTYTQSNLNHCHCTTHTHARHTRAHTFLTKGKLCICQGHRSNKGEARSSAARSDELCHLHVSTPLLTYTHTQTRAILLSHICRLVAQQCRGCHRQTEAN